MLSRSLGFLFLLTAVASRGASQPAVSGTVPVVVDGNRVYAQVRFLRSDGTSRQAFVFVDMGSPSPLVSEELFNELRLGDKAPLRIQVGNLTAEALPGSVESTNWFPHFIAGKRKVEGLLPAGVLRKYQVVLDYAQAKLTLAPPGALKPEGAPVPIRINEKTGLIVVDASINGASYPLTIDNGSAYTWLRKSAARDWVAAHPEWQRGVGAVGASNMRMASDGVEATGTLLRLPEILLGPVRLQQVGALAIGPSETSDHFDMIGWYSSKNPEPVVGWLGGNVLRGFCLTIDYPNRMSYWVSQSPPDTHDLDQVGLTLQFAKGEYVVAGIAAKKERPTVEGVEVGDKLLQIDELQTKGASWGLIFAALHGKPGEVRALVLERKGKPLRIQAVVTAF